MHGFARGDHLQPAGCGHSTAETRRDHLSQGEVRPNLPALRLYGGEQREAVQATPSEHRGRHPRPGRPQ